VSDETILSVNQLVIPANLACAAGDADPGLRDWLAGLPPILAEVSRRWRLRLDEPFEPGGSCSWVAPATGPAGDELVLKLGQSHEEALHEAAGLRAWDGEGAVRLYDALTLDGTIALLLERCSPGTMLGRLLPEPEQDVVVAGLLKRLWRHPAQGHPFRPLQLMCERWADEFGEKWSRSRSPLDPGIAREGIALFRSLSADPGDGVLLCTDLHAENILAAEREPWLAIDPKPYVGDPAYDLLQHMLNCEERLRTDPRGLASRMANLTDLDRDRVTRWLFARCVQESLDWPQHARTAALLA
jgi:streptomycin 6-kinase